MLPDNPTDNRLETNKPTLQKNQGGSIVQLWDVAQELWSD